MSELFRRLRSLAVVLVLVSVGFYVISLNFRAPARMGAAQRIVVEMLGPLFGAVRSVSQTLDEVVRDYVWLRRLRRENEELRRQVNDLHNRLAVYHEAFLENQRLRRLLDFKETLSTPSIVARVVLHDPTGWFRTVIVDKGAEDGVNPDMAVVNEEGVVGRVLDVSDHHARVLLVTDRESAVDAVVQRNRVRGILSGKDEKSCLLRYVRGNFEVRTGDLVVTSGKDGVFPRGLRLGTVRQVIKDPVGLFQTVIVKPVADLNAVEEVLIFQTGRAPPPEWEEEEPLG